MNPKKLIGFALIALGFLFRAISLTYYNVKSKQTPESGKERRRLLRGKRNALIIDYAFIALGVYVILV